MKKYIKWIFFSDVYVAEENSAIVYTRRIDETSWVKIRFRDKINFDKIKRTYRDVKIYNSEEELKEDNFLDWI